MVSLMTVNKQCYYSMTHHFIIHIKTSKGSLDRPTSNLGSIHREVYLSVWFRRSGWHLHALIRNLLTGHCAPKYFAMFLIFLPTNLTILIVFKMSFIIINNVELLILNIIFMYSFSHFFFWNGWWSQVQTPFFAMNIEYNSFLLYNNAN